MAVTHGPRWLSAACIVMSVTIGCGSAPEAGPERFIPASATARSAIESALQAWQRGEPAGEVKDTRPQVFVADTHRRKGQTLDRFEILGEVPGATPACYLIKLKFSNSESEEKVRFAVVGVDPLWVFRNEDLEMLLHWDHPMPAVEEKAASESTPNDRQTEETSSGTQQ